MKRFWMLRGLKMLAVVILGGVALGYVVMSLWNWLLPPLFGWRVIGFWQGLGMLALCRILFGGFGCHSQHGPGFRRRWSERHASMTPEERERFRQGMRDRCGFRPPEGENTGQAAQ